MTTDVQDTQTAPKAQDITPRKSIWMRGLYMVITAFLIGAAQSVLFLLAVVQFILMLISRGERNVQIAEFGDVIAKWLAAAAKYQTAKSEDKPWPMGPLT